MKKLYSTIGLFVLMVISFFAIIPGLALSAADDYGGAAVTSIFLNLWNDWWVLIIFFLAIGFILAFLPKWLRDIFGGTLS